MELQRILDGLGIEVVGLEEGSETEEVETGSTFEENALLKARLYHVRSGLPAIADDSGLEVDALRGAPGLFSARYGGAGGTDTDRIARLLEEMRTVPCELRAARFVCAAAFVWDEGERVFAAEARGKISKEPRGAGGFGYDPVFFYEPLGMTFGEMEPAQKLRVSHRGLAFQKLSEWLRGSGLLDSTKSGDRMVFPRNIPAPRP